MEPISDADKEEAVNLYVAHLLTVKQVSERLGISTGAVSEILAERRRKKPDLDELRKLNMSLRKSGANWLDAMRGANALQRLDALELDLQDVSRCADFLERYKKNARLSLQAAVRLQGLESRTGKTFEEIIVEFEAKQKALSQLDMNIEEEKGRDEELRNSIREHEALKGLQDDLDENDISKNKLCEFITRYKQFEEMGFTLEVASKIANELAKFNMTPAQAAGLLAKLLAEYDDVSSAVNDASAKKRELESTIFNQNSQIDSLARQLYMIRQEHNLLQNTILTYKRELENIQRAIEESANRYEHLEDEMKEKFDKEKTRLEGEIESRRNTIAALEDDLLKLNEEIQKIESAMQMHARIASLVLLIQDPAIAGERMVVIESTLAVIGGLLAYVKRSRSKILNWVTIEQALEATKKELSNEIRNATSST